MVAFKAQVENGRIRLDEPTDLPDGKEVSVVLLDDDGLTEADREKLMRMIDESLMDEAAGNVESLSKLIHDLRSQL